MTNNLRLEGLCSSSCSSDDFSVLSCCSSEERVQRSYRTYKGRAARNRIANGPKRQVDNRKALLALLPGSLAGGVILKKGPISEPPITLASGIKNCRMRHIILTLGFSADSLTSVSTEENLGAKSPSPSMTASFLRTSSSTRAGVAIKSSSAGSSSVGFRLAHTLFTIYCSQGPSTRVSVA